MQPSDLLLVELSRLAIYQLHYSDIFIIIVVAKETFRQVIADCALQSI